VQDQVVRHERDDEGSVYPRLAKVLMEGHGLSAMSRAHCEILHLARLLARVVDDLSSEKIDRYLIRDAQRVIEAIEALARIIPRRKKTSMTPSWRSRRSRCMASFAAMMHDVPRLFTGGDDQHAFAMFHRCLRSRPAR
jgi:hypothetical protein